MKLIQRAVVMRHSRRADKDGQKWDEMHVRTWDPPLSDQGIKLLHDTLPVLPEILGSIKKVITSPFLRCVQTADAVRKTFGLQPESLEVNMSLSELYDYFNSVRYVDSPDIWRDGAYVNMSEWFFKYKHMNIDQGVNHLLETTTMKEILRKRVDNVFVDHKVCVEGNFPDFERYLPLPFLITPRFCEVFRNATDDHDENLVFVTHMSGVISIINNLFGYIRYYVRPCDYFVLERRRRCENESWGKWNLLHPHNLKRHADAVKPI